LHGLFVHADDGNAGSVWFEPSGYFREGTASRGAA